MADRKVLTPAQLERRALLGVALVSLVLFGACGLCGVTFAIAEAITAAKIAAARGWPTTSGRIVESHVTTSRSGGKSSRTSHHVEATYEYTVGGQRYRSSRITYGVREGARSSTEAENLRSRYYPPGGSVTVHYDPDDPGEAVLSPGTSGGFTAVGLTMMAFSLLCAAALFLKGRALVHKLTVSLGREARGGLTPEQHLQNLAVAALADGELAPEEEAHLVRRAAQWGLGDAAAVRAALEGVRGGQRAFHVPKEAAAREKMYLTIVDALRADGTLTERELRMLDALAEKAQVPPEVRKHAES